jgi:hypothetical protein
MQKLIKLLLNKKLLFKVASILAFFFALAFFSIPLAVYWYDYLWFAYSIALIFAVAYYIPTLVSYLIDIHDANQEQDEQLEDQEPYFFDTSKLLSFPKKLICQLLLIKKPDNI